MNRYWPGPALPHAQVEARILLLVDQRIRCRIRAERVPLHALGQQGDGILGDVEQGAVIGGPDEIRFHVGHGIRQRRCRTPDS